MLPDGGTFIYYLHPLISMTTFLTDVLSKVSFREFDRTCCHFTTNIIKG